MSELHKEGVVAPKFPLERNAAVAEHPHLFTRLCENLLIIGAHNFPVDVTSYDNDNRRTRVSYKLLFDTEMPVISEKRHRLAGAVTEADIMDLRAVDELSKMSHLATRFTPYIAGTLSTRLTLGPDADIVIQQRWMERKVPVEGEEHSSGFSGPSEFTIIEGPDREIILGGVVANILFATNSAD